MKNKKGYFLPIVEIISINNVDIVATSKFESVSDFDKSWLSGSGLTDENL